MTRESVTVTRRLTKRKEAAVSYGAVPFHSIDRPPAAGRTGTAPSSPSVSASGETEEGRQKKRKEKGRRRFRHRSPRLVVVHS